MSGFFEQFIFYMLLAFGVGFFLMGFKGLFQASLIKVPGLHGLATAAAA